MQVVFRGDSTVFQSFENSTFILLTLSRSQRNRKPIPVMRYEMDTAVALVLQKLNRSVTVTGEL